jgi:hypothetical protein
VLVKRGFGLGVCGALAWLAATAGCSLIAVMPPTKSQKPRVDVACTVDGYAPAIDLAGSTGGVATLFSNDPWTDSKALLLIGSAAYLGSGIYGLVTTGKCAKAKNAAYAYHATLLKPESEPPTQDAPAAPSRPRPPPADEEDEPEVKVKPSGPRPPPPQGSPE